MDRFLSRQSASSPGSSSAAQPVVTPGSSIAAQRLVGDAAQLVVSSSQQSASTKVYKFASYNIGWNITDKSRSATRLANELLEVWWRHSFHAIGLSEVFEVDYPPQTLVAVNAQRQAILNVIVAAFNDAAATDDAAQLVVWQGRVDGHCMYLWHSSLGLLHADYISLGITEQPWRKAQYLCFRPADALAPLHVYHLHSPSPGKKKKDKQDRRLTKTARFDIVSTICRHAVQQHRSGAAQPAVNPWPYNTYQYTWPSVLLTGDFNNTAIQWKDYLSKLVPERILNHAQLVWSTVLRERKHGDISVAINCGEAYQEEGPDSTTCTFSDNHDVVLVPVRLHAKIVTTMISGTDDDLGPTEDRSAAQPALESMGHNPTKAVSSAEITQTINAPRQNIPGYAQIVNSPTEDRSAAQLALESRASSGIHWRRNHVQAWVEEPEPHVLKAVSSAELTQVMVERAPEIASAAQPAPTEDPEYIPAETLNAPRQNTPMYSQFVKNLADLEPTDGEDDGRRKTRPDEFNVVTSLDQMLQMYMFRTS